MIALGTVGSAVTLTLALTLAGEAMVELRLRHLCRNRRGKTHEDEKKRDQRCPGERQLRQGGSIIAAAVVGLLPYKAPVPFEGNSRCAAEAELRIR